MKKAVVGLLAMCVGFALLRMLVTALLLGLAVLLVFSFITRPRETVAFLGGLLVVGLASARPGAFIIVVGIVALAMVALCAWRKPQRRLLLSDDREPPADDERLDRKLLG